MASKFRQDMPPPGGYDSISWMKKAGGRGTSGVAVFGGFFAVSAIGLSLWFVEKKLKRLNELEMSDGRLALEPFIVAEQERMFLKQLRKNRIDEEELMKDVQGWKTGTLWGEPVYWNQAKRFPVVHAEEYFMHNTDYDMFDRLYEKRWH